MKTHCFSANHQFQLLEDGMTSWTPLAPPWLKWGSGREQLWRSHWRQYRLEGPRKLEALSIIGFPWRMLVGWGQYGKLAPSHNGEFSWPKKRWKTGSSGRLVELYQPPWRLLEWNAPGTHQSCNPIPPTLKKTNLRSNKSLDFIEPMVKAGWQWWQFHWMTLGFSYQFSLMASKTKTSKQKPPPTYLQIH